MDWRGICATIASGCWSMRPTRMQREFPPMPLLPHNSSAWSGWFWNGRHGCNRPATAGRAAATVEAAVAALGQRRRRVFLTIGRQEADAFSAAPQHGYVVRSVDPVDPPLAAPDVSYLLARGPFTVEDELALMTERGIEALVSKNSGGIATYAKLEAARRLGIEVVMIDRPAVLEGQRYETVTAALDAIDRLYGFGPRDSGEGRHPVHSVVSGMDRGV